MKCNNCGKKIDKTQSSYYVKQQIHHGTVEEIEFCDLSCIKDYELHAS